MQFDKVNEKRNNDDQKEDNKEVNLHPFTNNEVNVRKNELCES